jgi:hypothetical protein
LYRYTDRHSQHQSLQVRSCFQCVQTQTVEWILRWIWKWNLQRDHLVTVYVYYTTHLVGPVLALSLISHQEFRTARNFESDGNSLASWQVTKGMFGCQPNLAIRAVASPYFVALKIAATPVAWICTGKLRGRHTCMCNQTPSVQCMASRKWGVVTCGREPNTP